MYVSILPMTDERSIQFREIRIFTEIQWLLFGNRENEHYNKKKFWRICRRPMVTLPALSPVDPHVHSLKIPRRPSTWICVTKTVTIWSNILTNVVRLSRKIFWAYRRIYKQPMVIQRHPPFPHWGDSPGRQHVNTVKVWCNILATL